MDALLRELEELRISGSSLADDILWKKCTEFVTQAYVPEKLIGASRPCEEKDFTEYRITVEKKLQNILILLELVRRNRDKGAVSIDSNSANVRRCGIHVILLAGEHSEKSLWNSVECVRLAKEILCNVCNLFECATLSEMMIATDNKFSTALTTLRPKLLKETWRHYPAAVLCYKWLLHQVDEPVLSRHLGLLLPTALIIFDDFVPSNRLVGLECIYRILSQSSMASDN